MNGTKAIDVPCAACGAEIGSRCTGNTFCQERKNAAVKKTKEANVEARKKAP